MNTLIFSALKAIGPLRRHYHNWCTLCATWEAAQVHGRVEALNSTPHAGLTKILPKALWSNLFVAQGYDVNADGSHREHEGEIVQDPTNPSRFRRTVRYRDSVEVSHQ